MARPKRLHSNSIHVVILNILKNKKNPMTITEITESVLKKKSMKSVRPNCTINAILQRSQYVTKTERGCYKLNSNVKF